MDTTLPVEPKCPFCRKNSLLKGSPVAETDDAYAIEDNTFPGSYLIIPNQHIESVFDLANDWWKDVKALMEQLTIDGDFSLALNCGKHAGQSVKHLHLWVIPRAADMPASGKGLARLIREAGKQRLLIINWLLPMLSSRSLFLYPVVHQIHYLQNILTL